jgi:hypothetical protein
MLDTSPPHSLQLFGVPQYLPREIHGFNSVSQEDFVRHHERVCARIAEGHLTFGFDEQGVETSLALVFGLEVPLNHQNAHSSPVTKKFRVLQIYYEAPAVEDLPPGVLGAAGSHAADSAWTEQSAQEQSRIFVHSPSHSVPSKGKGGSAS